MARIVLWRPMYDQRAVEALVAAGHLVEVVNSSAPRRICAALGNADALWVRTPERVTAEILNCAPRLRFISTSGRGTDNIDIDEARRRKITVVNHAGLGRVPVSEHAIMLAMWLLHNVIDSDARTLATRVAGIVGMGSIGSEIARKLVSGFGCDVVTYSRDQRLLAPILGTRSAKSPEEVFSSADVLFLAGAWNRSIGYRVGTAELDLLSPGSIVVNVARGKLLDHDAVHRALRQKRLAGVGLDTVDPEPLPPGHPLLGHPKVVLTPHTGGLSVETNTRASFAAADALIDLLAGKATGRQSRPHNTIHPA
ncbi:NAD(P)-dependent oxidoreductase [Mycolicibacterium sp.]|uniref:NAD(P)-dependent oxidoreductase n=1 Tax=Mycolicibacterium sp. TaxID=2320850 RepID=UPI0037CABBC6